MDTDKEPQPPVLIDGYWYRACERCGAMTARGDALCYECAPEEKD